MYSIRGCALDSFSVQAPWTVSGRCRPPHVVCPCFKLGKSRNMPRLAGTRQRTLEWDKFTKESTMRSTAVFLIIYYCRGALSRLHMSRLRPPPMLTPSPSCIPPLSARHHCRILSFSTPRFHTDRIRHKYAPS